MRFFLLPALLIFSALHGQDLRTPDQLYGKLFVHVQQSGIFHDSKTFVDCIPRKDPQQIVRSYNQLNISQNDTAALRAFVLEHFVLPADSSVTIEVEKDLEKHIHLLWGQLQRQPQAALPYSSLIALPQPYLVPGGRFREIYYWDSYFTMLGLKESKENRMILSMVENFAHLLATYGKIPNGNRTYYLGRSQPPFFSLMIDLLAEVEGSRTYARFAPALQNEWNYWAGEKSEGKTLVKSRNGEKLFRYWDEFEIPRQESFREDQHTVQLQLRYFTNNSFVNKDSLARRTYKHLRAAAASGWDFSSRWFRAAMLPSTSTLDFAPVDLNALLHHLHETKEKAAGNEKRISNMEKFTNNFFNDSLGWYCDHDLLTGKPAANPTLAGMVPLFLNLADKKLVPRVVQFLQENFLKEGGLVTSLRNTGEQWDAPNGWAPLQWMTIIGLENYGYHDLARDIAQRWFRLNKKVFEETGKLMEKYNVIDLEAEAGGGEYPSQDGFGWTNGVLLALIKKYNLR